MYYRLSTDGMDTVYTGKEPGCNSHVGLAMGRAWDVAKDEIDLPYRFEMSVAEGQTPKLYGWYPGSDLMQQRLVDVLRSAGVDNLQTFPAVIKREDNGEDVPGYVVVNIVGRISCAVLGQSDTSPLADVYYFNDLTIDPRRTQGMLMFRLDESPMVVLVHEKVAKAIEAAGFLGVTLEAVKESAG